MSIPDEDDGPDAGGGAPVSTSLSRGTADASVVVDMVTTGSETARVPSPSSATVVVTLVVVVAATVVV
ncbi:MAG: hypothetical protein VX568_08935, partial [Actinomycetota bacterium]|nr:hypothetical protein [Actinomycetota bacterium]